jgi:hypothetical protein
MDDNVDEYYKNKTIELENELGKYKKIYLDTRFWLNFRDVSMSRNTNSKLCEIYSLMQENIAKKKILCPISYDIFIEVMKQEDEETRYKTIELIDEFSLGVTLVPEHERIKNELLRLILNHTKQKYNVTSVWTKVVHILSPMIPEPSYLFPDKEKQKIKKLWIDYSWKISLMEMFKKTDLMNRAKMSIKNDISKKLNEEKIEHFDGSSFEKIYMAEISGILTTIEELYSPIENVLTDLYISQYGGEPNSEDDFNMQLMNNLIYNLFEHNKINISLPSIDIMAGLHTTIRMDKRRKYDPNDFHDFSHARSALPYFDYFFTEGGLAHLVKQKNLNYDVKYSCKVASSYNEILELLRDL